MGMTQPMTGWVILGGGGQNNYLYNLSNSIL